PREPVRPQLCHRPPGSDAEQPAGARDCLAAADDARDGLRAATILFEFEDVPIELIEPFVRLDEKLIEDLVAFVSAGHFGHSVQRTHRIGSDVAPLSYIYCRRRAG
ncbi:MAG: hypothetical protein ACK55I_43160, partial [bacterium]